jgi:enoyl-CoA hydratase
VELVRIKVRDGLAWLTLSNPGKRNVLDSEMACQMVDRLDELESNESVRVIAITGEPPAFCSGADLGALRHADDQSLRTIYEAFLRVARCALPTVAAVNGAAVGAGMNLALACDVRIAGRSARFESRFLRIGLHPGGGHVFMASSSMTAADTAASLLFGQSIGGDDAEKRGLVWKSVPDDELQSYVEHFTEAARSTPRELLIRTKRTLRGAAYDERHRNAVDAELKEQIWSTRQGWFDR